MRKPWDRTIRGALRRLNLELRRLRAKRDFWAPPAHVWIRRNLLKKGAAWEDFNRQVVNLERRIVKITDRYVTRRNS